MQHLGSEDHTRVQACAGIKEVSPAYLLKNSKKTFGSDD